MDLRLNIIRDLIKANLSPTRRKRDPKWVRRKKNILRQIYGDHCCYCGIEMIFKPKGCADVENNHATIEHIIPLSLGGSNDLYNMRIACDACNNWAAKEIIKMINEIQNAK